MPVLILVLALSMVLFDTVHETQASLREQHHAREARTLGADMLVIRNALAAYADIHPGVHGEVQLASLGLPAWFHPQPGIRAHVEGDQLFVYYTPTAGSPKPDVSSALNAAPTQLTGVAAGLRLVSPRAVSNLTLPPAIPEDSIVLAY